MKYVNILLVEDELEEQLDYIHYQQTYPNLFSLNVSSGVAEGNNLISEFKPDVIILDLELHESDGDGLVFLQQFRDRKSNSPFIIVITQNTSIRTRTIARKFGADYIFLKTKPDYSAKLVIDFAISCMDNFIFNNSVEQKIHLELNVIMTSELEGRKYLSDSILMLVQSEKDLSLNRDVFSAIANKYNKPKHSIERCIETAIEKAWNTTDTEILVSHYQSPISSVRGCPTNKEFIHYYVNKIKNDLGRA